MTTMCLSHIAPGTHASPAAALARLQQAQPGGPQLHYVLAQHAAVCWKHASTNAAHAVLELRPREHCGSSTADDLRASRARTGL